MDIFDVSVELSPKSKLLLVDEVENKLLSPRRQSEDKKFLQVPDRKKEISFLPKSPKQVVFSKLSKVKESSEKVRKNLFGEEIPKFYLKEISLDEVTNDMLRITEYFFRAPPEGFTEKEFEKVTVSICSLPKYLNTTLFEKLRDDKYVKYIPFLDEIQGKAEDNRFFNVLKKKGNDYITPKELSLLLDSILNSHPGLEFLQQEGFREKYKETVIIRIFYTINNSKNDKITISEFKKSNFVSVLKSLKDLDINRELNYFSYEHFYVLYCKFWDLDEDHDFILSKNELMLYDPDGLNPYVIERVYQGFGKKLKIPNKFTYEDFIWFCLSEEDKTTIPSIEYWFRVLDTDGDQLLTAYELKQFYDSYNENLQSDLTPFGYIFNQLIDVVQPKNNPIFTLSDLKKCKLSYLFLNAFCNINKFLSYDARDPNQREAKESFWNRFARNEYDRMAQEDDEFDEAPTPIVSFNPF